MNVINLKDWKSINKELRSCLVHWHTIMTFTGWFWAASIKQKRIEIKLNMEYWKQKSKNSKI